MLGNLPYTPSDRTGFLNDYFRVMRGVLGPVYRPQDLYVATRLGALEAIDSGTTTLVDWAHLMNTPAHADASVHALRDTNIRAVFGYGNSNAGFQLPNTIRLDAADAKRVRDQYFTGSGLVTMALSVRGPDYSPEEVWMDDLRRRAHSACQSQFMSARTEATPIRSDSSTRRSSRTPTSLTFIATH